MGIRQTLNRHPVAAVCVVVVAAAIATAVILWQGGEPSAESKAGLDASMRAFFSVDDGRSYFPGDARTLPPFKTPDGKTAYRAQVVRCGNGEPYVAYLERFTDADKARLEAALKRSGGSSDPMLIMGGGARVAVKKAKTGDAGWVQLSAETHQRYQAIVEARCPDGSLPARVSP